MSCCNPHQVLLSGVLTTALYFVFPHPAGQILSVLRHKCVLVSNLRSNTPICVSTVMTVVRWSRRWHCYWEQQKPPCTQWRCLRAPVDRTDATTSPQRLHARQRQHHWQHGSGKGRALSTAILRCVSCTTGETFTSTTSQGRAVVHSRVLQPASVSALPMEP